MKMNPQYSPFTRFFGPLHPILYFASAPNAASGAAPTGGDGGSGGAGAGSGAPSGTGSTGAPGNGTGTGGGTGAPTAIDWNTAPQHLRSAYDQLKKDHEGIKTKYEPWEKLGVAPEAVTRQQQQYNAIVTEAKGIAEELGYTEDDLQEAVEQKGLLPTLDYLRRAASEQQSDDPEHVKAQDLQQQIEESVNKALTPYQKRENDRITGEANALFERTVHGTLAEVFKGEGTDITKVDQKELFMLTNAVSEMLKYDAQALHDLKYGGKTAAVQKLVHTAKGFLDNYYLARATRERGAIPTGKARPGQPAPITGRKPTLDEMAEDPDLIRTSQGKSGYTT